MKTLIPPFMLLALSQVQLDVLGCTDLYKTIELVSDCPRTEPEWNAASIRKNCDVVCPQSRYHCVISKEMNATMEVCAEPKYLQGYCAYFNSDEDRIRNLLAADCSKFPNPCPNRYMSTDAFKYTACYDLIKLYVVPSVQTTSEITGQESNGKTGGRQTEETLDMGIIVGITLSCVVILMFVIALLIVFIRRRKQSRIIIRQGKHIDFSKEERMLLKPDEEKINIENESSTPEIQELKMKCEEQDTELKKLREQIEKLSKVYLVETEGEKKLTEKQEREHLALKQQYLAKNEECKELNNKLQEAKGNIRVLCRIRKTDGKDKCLTVAGNSVSVKYAAGTQKQDRKFSFEKVFEENCKQTDVYCEIRELIRSFLDGYNLCIFAYGQTGSGKTYTMDGESEIDKEGIIPRAIKQVFQDSEAATCGGWTYEFSASYLELYNEKIRDLAKGDKDKEPHDINRIPKGKVHVTNLTECNVNTKEEVMEFYKAASKNRTSSKTKMNEESSRSHAVFRLEMKGEVREVQGRNDTCSGTLTLVDLAGSEKIDQQAGATTNRETNKINLSLLELGKVLRGLLKKENVTYRSSILTRLLETSLGGNSKTLMIVNVSPSMECLNETERSLKFGSEVSKVVLEKARKNK
ncbi:carboxy-terminal kinesin 2-like isoform X1 [Ostrea edulis]|uniref:carboxy-terminal kinesin 2-like isoform X1 n=1 Tax=Ostrea edulis TaxID=37623 RepID=UPI0020946C71|nr:carboxy-terminal kinesin 2-like isoform X1 [Ostrea edulis]XP_048767054.1 carboxy-terminal kinesin 2-like isoform X1 [Ostrea edulis]XP_048767055.1 carboxy-terminal kinesin 2-like isoform X1 [Ostrea edulis]